MYRRLTINTLINIINVGFNIIVGFILTPLFIHTLGNALYGIWVFILSLSVQRGVLVVFDLGISGSTVKFVAEYDAKDQPERVNDVFSAALITYLVIGAILAIALIVFGTIGAGLIFRIPVGQEVTTRSLVYYLALQTLFDFPAMAVSGILEGLQRYDITRGCNIMRLCLYAILSLLFLVMGAGVYALALATFFSELGRLLGHLYFIRRVIPGLRVTRHFSRGLLRTMFRFSGKLFIFSIATTIYDQMDQVIVSVLLTTTLLTDYDVSDRLHTLVFALTTMIGPFILSAASALHAKNDRVELHRLLIRATRYTAALVVPVALIVIVLAGYLTQFWLGPEFLHTVPATRLFISYLLYWLLLRVGQNMLIGKDQLRIVLPAFIFSTAVNLAISIVTAPMLGVTGVILGTVIGILYMVAFNRQLELTTRDLVREILLRVYPQAIIGALVVQGLTLVRPPTSLLQVGLYGTIGLVVFAIHFIFVGMPGDERKFLSKYALGLTRRLIR
jgi:O-antigen/teichoic acid export membrane protein